MGIQISDDSVIVENMHFVIQPGEDAFKMTRDLVNSTERYVTVRGNIFETEQAIAERYMRKLSLLQRIRGRA